MLRTGRRNKSTNIFGILRRLIKMIRVHWKKSRFIVRGDGHFCSKEFMDWATGVDYVDFVFSLTGNPELNGMVGQWVEKEEAGYKKYGEEVRIFRRLTYKAGSWEHPQRVVVKIEVKHHGTNVRFIVTSFKHHNSRFLYEKLYSGGGGGCYKAVYQSVENILVFRQVLLQQVFVQPVPPVPACGGIRTFTRPQKRDVQWEQPAQREHPHIATKITFRCRPRENHKN